METQQLIQAASAAHAANQFSEASRLCAQVLEAEPYNVQALLLTGVIEAKVGDPVRAIQVLDEVLGIEPNSYFASFWQAHACKKIGKGNEALHAARRAVELSPNDPQGIAQLGICQMDVRLLKDAEENLKKAISLAPNVIPIQYNLSQCLFLRGNLKEGQAVLLQALRNSRQNVESLLKLAQFLLTQNNAHGAEACVRYALDIAPRSDLANLLLARILLEENRSTEAEPCIRVALEQGSTDAQAHAMLGMAVQSLGRLDEAVGSFRKSIEREPRQGYAYFTLVHSKRIVEEDRPMVERMLELVDDPDLPTAQITFLRYGIGKALEDLGEYEGSMAAFDEANRLEATQKFKDRKFDRRQYADSFDRTIRQFSAKFLAQHRTAGSESDVPIFVVGMMRSGTTLVEQILSCHSRVAAAGEQVFWLDNWREAMNEPRHELNGDGLRSSAERYLALLQTIAPGAERIVDKMPVNYAGLGIIHLAFPNAKIIHTRRDPVDTCLSIYTTPNRALTEYAHVRENIVFAYRQYLKVMEHWRKVLPADAFLDVDYEALVSNSEPVIRQIVDFCGLEWDDRCLRPHENPRAVVTPSVWQVRQPFYRSSVQRWRRFEPWLGPFGELLPKESLG
ncbi:MAG: sulfotransferase [Fimbriimonas sp.]|nr:sulfotransferase [Fimbriimonas sp.]